ncbi:CCA tRNA nucleotidyltransferase [Candidatus Kuenenbacteria bacterium]|nr:CCA tRNA nucleotidyltransferase [Candidatus Kuenenbacteria bacterium]
MEITELEKIMNNLEQGGFLAWTKNVYEKDGAEVYLVGGAVRDGLLGFKHIKDYDFVVRGWSMEELGEKLKELGKVDLVGKSFGVYKFVPAGKKMPVAYDIALPRKEISLATGRYRDFKVDYDERLKIKDDLARRDFTINAMAYELKSKKLVDEFGGLKDLADKKIRTVGNPYERFEEDYSRMLRGIRFACQLNWNFEDGTRHALNDLAGHINDQVNGERIVPYEVIASELLRTFVSNPVRAFDLYDALGIFKELAPELLKMKACPQPKNWHSEGDVWQHTRLCLKALQSEALEKRFKSSIIFDDSKSEHSISAELVMAALWHDVGKPYTIKTPAMDGTDRLRFNNHDAESAKLAQENFEKLRLSAAPEFDFDPERAVWLIAKHHLFDTKKLEEMKNSTVEKYFFGERYVGEDLLKLGFADMSASIRADTGEPDLENFDIMVARINELKQLGKDRKLPEPLLNGNEVMEILKMKPGAKVGEILGNLREKQLSAEVKNKYEAIRYIQEIV